MREFTRYSTDIPVNIEIQSVEPKVINGCQMTSISHGGLCCEIDSKVEVGCKVNINIPSVLPAYFGFGEVSWCQAVDTVSLDAVSRDTASQGVLSQDALSKNLASQNTVLQNEKTGHNTFLPEIEQRFEIGVRFTDSDDVITSRMVQQVCQIEHYKNIVFDREGTLLDGKQAAEQWIAKHREGKHNTL